MKKLMIKQMFLFDPWPFDIRKGIFDRIRRACDESIEEDRFSTTKIASVSIRKIIKN
jgi:hypothetical protein